MEFPLMVVEEAWERAGGRCECHHSAHGHHIPCGRPLKLESRDSDNRDGWVAHAHDKDGTRTLDNCEILCYRCYKQTRIYSG